MARPAKEVDALPPLKALLCELPCRTKLTLPVGGMSGLVEVTVAERLAVSQGRVLELTNIVTVGDPVWAVAWVATNHRRADSATTAATTARTNDTLAPLGFIPR